MKRMSVEELIAQGPAQAAEMPKVVQENVKKIISNIRNRGDEALQEYRTMFDPNSVEEWERMEIPKEQWHQALEALPKTLREALEGMAKRVRAFAEKQREAFRSFEMEIEPGVICGQRVQPIESVGCYVPAGRHPLPSTAMMTAIPAKVAGVKKVVIASPNPSPEILAVAALAEADVVLAIGGAHGIAAMAFGTEQVPRVDLICGPGGVYVTEAKQQLSGIVGIDLPAGPTEVLVLAGEDAHADWVMADLLAQAEHDTAARPLLGTTSEALAQAIEAKVAAGFGGHPNQEAIEASIAANGVICVCDTREQLADIANAIAPEHLSIHVENPRELLKDISHFGAAFLGESAAEVFGDYGVGPNHVLPTGGASRFTAGLSVSHFLRLQTTIEMSPDAAKRLAEPTAAVARAEGLESHAQAALCRG